MSIGRTCICGRVALPGTSRCALHPPAPRPDPPEAQRAAYRGHYSTAAYRKNRVRRFELSGGRCEVCGVSLEGRTWHAHHVRSVRDGGDDSIDNLRVLCETDHHTITRQSRRSRRP